MNKTGILWHERPPHAENGNVIGLFGGSFNPPHQGHVLVAQTAIRRLQLDQLWWMVTPGNPLKDRNVLAPLEQRVQWSVQQARNPKIKVTTFETALKSPNSATTIAYLKHHYSHVHFVWIMGGDSLATFHYWHDWQSIAQTLPIAIIDRPQNRFSALQSKMAVRYRQFRLPESSATTLAFRSAPAWIYLHGPRSSMSSTRLRMDGALGELKKT